MVALDLLIRPAVQSDQNRIANLIHFEQYAHRHLDWRGPLDWVGSPYFWVAQQNGRAVSALACPPDPESVFWLRLFACASSVPLRDSWRAMWETARLALRGQSGQVAVIALHDWMAALVEDSGFVYADDIVMLAWSAGAHPAVNLPQHVDLRPMQVSDLPEVAEVDQAAFARLWQNSLPSLRLAFPQAGAATVAVVDSQIVGYQISTFGPFGAHLARLAVHPRFQGQGVGRALLADLTKQVTAQGFQRITVNTQGKNHVSQALYRKMGFAPSGESYPVYTWLLPESAD